jgi:hypothetical protein
MRVQRELYVFLWMNYLLTIAVFSPKPSAATLAEQQQTHNKEDDLSKFEVDFGPDEPANPLSWSRLRRWYITVLAGFLAVNAYVSFCSNSLL